MKYLEKITKLADGFENKIVRFAEEADSTMVTLSVRPVVNALLEKQRPIVQKMVQDIINSNAVASGDIKIGGNFSTNAKLQGGTWVVNPNSTGIGVSGTLATHPKISEYIKKFNGAAAQVVQKELNRVKGNLQGDTVTNHDTTVSNITFDF